jgi:hypothetical protein
MMTMFDALAGLAASAADIPFATLLYLKLELVVSTESLSSIQAVHN